MTPSTFHTIHNNPRIESLTPVRVIVGGHLPTAVHRLDSPGDSAKGAAGLPWCWPWWGVAKLSRVSRFQ